MSAARNQASVANTKAAANPADGTSVAGLVNAEAALGGALGKFFALAESYPDLKANQTMQGLMEELTSTENKVSFARQAYNDAVMSYNNGRETLPGALIASPFGFLPATPFEVTKSEEREAVKVSF